jgi:hypothetical protein
LMIPRLKPQLRVSRPSSPELDRRQGWRISGARCVWRGRATRRTACWAGLLPGRCKPQRQPKKTAVSGAWRANPSLAGRSTSRLHGDENAADGQLVNSRAARDGSALVILWRLGSAIAPWRASPGRSRPARRPAPGEVARRDRLQQSARWWWSISRPAGKGIDDALDGCDRPLALSPLCAARGGLCCFRVLALRLEITALIAAGAPGHGLRPPRPLCSGLTSQG